MKPRGVGRPAIAALLILLTGGCQSASNRAVNETTSEAYEVRDLTVLPQATYRVPPTMPRSGRRAGMHAEVLVDFVVNERGETQSVRVLRATSAEFADAAVAAVTQWRFNPGQKGGRAVRTHMEVPIIFSTTEK